MLTFACPTIIYGDDALDYLFQIDAKKAFIVTDRSVVRLGLTQRVTHQLDAAQIPWRIFDATESSRALAILEENWAELAQYQPDWVIGLGGSACINTAKAIINGLNHAVAQADGDAAAVCTARLMAIPTNSGNGTEDAWDMMLSHDQSAGIGYHGEVGMPDVAILDPEMVVQMPPQNTADHGMDIICKAVEGYASSWGSSITDGPALMALRQAFSNLARAYEDGADIGARMELQHAAILAELSSGNAMAGLGFSAGRALRAKFNLPRGRAVGLLLPYTMEFIINGSLKTTVKYAELARFCGTASGSDLDCALGLVAMIRRCAGQIDQPLNIKACGIGDRQFEAALPELVDRTLNEVMTQSVMRVPDRDNLAKIFQYAYEGTSIDF